MINVSDNRFNNELSKNGIYSLFSAFRNNKLDYDAFYLSNPIEESIGIVRSEVATKNSRFLDNKTTLREIKDSASETPRNILLITVESLSAEYLGVFGNKEHLTPNLDALASKSLLFDNFYATGTRTVRGMEALMLSIPPTPGRSIVKRPDNEGLFTIGSVLQKRGYDNKFIYGGHGYFDNMNAFFEGNGFKAIDRLDFEADEVAFENIWGVCDEDLFAKTIKEADKSFKENKPFFSFVMTTSNHRPYTYPEGKIDIPSHSGRNGAVKYTDYAIGKFIESAKTKPWFDNTLIVIVADHCAGSAGKTELPVQKYHIPLIVFNPKLISPQKIETLSSQIDVAPTLFGLMHLSYVSRFFGHDILDRSDTKERAFISNYQKLGLLNKDKLAILSPEFKSSFYDINLTNGSMKSAQTENRLLSRAIADYQTADYLYQNKQYDAQIKSL